MHLTGLNDYYKLGTQHDYCPRKIMQLVNTKKSSNYLSLVKVKDIVLLITVEVFTTSKKASEDRENIIQCRLPGASGQVQLPKSQ